MCPTLADRAYRRIRDRVLSGRYPPGSRLVNRSLARELGVSPIPVREALKRLASEGLVRHIPGAGAFVHALDRRELEKLYDFRACLEGFAAREAARTISEHRLRDLEALCETFHDLARAVRDERESDASTSPTVPGTEALKDSPDRTGKDGAGRDRTLFQRALETDMAFHRILIESADNPWLTKTVQDMRLLARVARIKAGEPFTLRRAAHNWRSHAALVRALRRRRPEEAESWMRIQLDRGLAAALEGVEEDGNWTA